MKNIYQIGLGKSSALRFSRRTAEGTTGPLADQHGRQQKTRPLRNLVPEVMEKCIYHYVCVSDWEGEGERETETDRENEIASQGYWSNPRPIRIQPNTHTGHHFNPSVLCIPTSLHIPRTLYILLSLYPYNAVSSLQTTTPVGLISTALSWRSSLWTWSSLCGLPSCRRGGWRRGWFTEHLTRIKGEFVSQ